MSKDWLMPVGYSLCSGSASLTYKPQHRLGRKGKSEDEIFHALLFFKMNYKCIIPLLLINSFASGQNLMLNPSMEDTIPCASYQGPPQLRAYYWFRPTGGSSDFLNASTNCGWGGGVPNNVYGFQYPNSFNSYLGFALYANPFGANIREYVEGSLNDSLKTGHKYCIQFYVSAANNSKYKIDAIGAFLSIDSVNFYPGGGLLTYVPQVANTQGNILSDTLNWMLISGEFIAQGGERFITIGNFKDDANTLFDTLQGAIYNDSYYYLDDVSVTDCTVGIDENTSAIKRKFDIKPNPVNQLAQITLQLTEKEMGVIKIFDLFGSNVDIIKIDALKNSATLNADLLNAGIYFARAFIGDELIGSEKLIILK